MSSINAHFFCKIRETLNNYCKSYNTFQYVLYATNMYIFNIIHFQLENKSEFPFCFTMHNNNALATKQQYNERTL